ncbi:MAG: 6-hydroxymethylpterin diphosphokinase MptE-like protein [Tepidisphaeraceae bacterium]
MTSATDPSQRLMLPADAPLLSNLAALWATEPKVALALEAALELPGHAVEKSKSGGPTVSVRRSDGRALYLHSRYEPVKEAERLIESIAVTRKTAFNLLGLGLGYHLELLFERASSEAIFCIFEPDIQMIRAALEHRDLSKQIASHRLLWFCDLDKSALFRRLTPHTALISVGSETIRHGPSVQLHDEFYKQVGVWLGEFASFSRTNMNTLLFNSEQTARNIARNIGWYAAAGGINRLGGRYRDCPAVIVSAGPSLRKNRHLLKGLEKCAVLIAVQTTLRPLLEMGCEPHFVTSLDYHEICTRFFEKLPAKIRTELVAEPKATPRVLEMMTGPVNLIGNDFADGLLRELKLGKPSLTSGATVAHLAFYLAEHLGCDPIIFVGQDLGFSDGLCYMPGTSYEDVWRPELGRFCTLEMKQWEQIVRDRMILRKIPDYMGRAMYTEERLFTYLLQFERDFGKSKARIIDATEGGARKRGSEVMPLAEAIAQYCRRPLPEIESDVPPLRWDLLGRCRESILLRKEEAGEIERISRETLPLLEEIRDNLSDQPRVNRAIALVDELRAKMDGFGRTYDQVMQFSQQTELKRFERDRLLAAARLEGLDRQKSQVERDIENVRAVIAAAEAFSQAMTEAAQELKRQSARRKEAA